MLSSLHIQNIALIEECTLTLERGLNILSGETGAGKSIIIDALSFVLGSRADKSLIRYGSTQATVEAVLPHVFDEIRYRLVEGKYPCVPIDSFGTFAVINVPERKHHYTYKGADEWRTLPPQKRLKFNPAYNLKRELQAGKFDETRKSFKHHPQDPVIRKRKDMKYRPCKNGVFKGATTYLKDDADSASEI